MQLAKQELDVGIVASDPAATCAFYRDLLGFKELPSIPLPEGALQHRFRIGRHWVKVNQLAEPPTRERGGIERAIGIRLLAFVLDDLDVVVKRLDTAGRRHASLAVGDASLYRIEVTKDPEGNVIELIGLHTAAGEARTDRMQIGLTVADVERSRRFYGGTLGLPEEPAMQVGGEIGTRYGFKWGTTTIKFWSLPQELPVQTGAPTQRAGLRMVTALVEDVDTAHAELVAKGVPIALPPTDLGGAARIMFMTDPDGNWLELAQRISK
jgi:catechol 2,3-dioxygenase-like lactoylglutathione lyase family enzyme